MRTLVVGANGLVGSRLCALLSRQEHSVIAVARGASRLSTPVAEYHSVDLADASTLHSTIVTARPDVIINCAAMTDVDGCEREPDKAYVANVEAVATLCRAAKASQAHLVHISTDYVFDGETGNYVPEARPSPRGTYAITKYLGEETIRILAPKDGWAICRTAVVYGWPAAGQKNFGTWLYDSLQAGQTVKLFEDQFVCPTEALNVAAMVGEIALRKLSGIWHTAGATVLNRVDFAKAMCAKFGLNSALIQPSRMADVKLLSPRPAKSGLDVSKTHAQLQSKPWALDEALTQFANEIQGRK